MTRDTLTAAEQSLNYRIQRMRGQSRGESCIEMSGECLRRQLRILTIVITIVGTILAIETTTIAVLRIWYGF